MGVLLAALSALFSLKALLTLLAAAVVAVCLQAYGILERVRNSAPRRSRRVYGEPSAPTDDDNKLIKRG
jgi:hypothetical protein